MTKRATEYLDRLLQEGARAGADTVELERVPEGLEVSFIRAGSGIGTVLKDRALESEVIELIVRRAGLDRRANGKMSWKIDGQDRAIAVEEYNSFGESCFRLKFGKKSKKTSNER